MGRKVETLLTNIEVKEGHAQQRCHKSPWKKHGAKQRQGLHGRAIAFACMRKTTLLLGHLKIEFGLSLGHDVVQLVDENG